MSLYSEIDLAAYSAAMCEWHANPKLDSGTLVSDYKKKGLAQTRKLIEKNPYAFSLVLQKNWNLGGTQTGNENSYRAHVFSKARRLLSSKDDCGSLDPVMFELIDIQETDERAFRVGEELRRFFETESVIN